MRKVILNLAVTLDGFIEGPNGEIDWCSFDTDSGPDSNVESHFDEFLDKIDTIFYGRVSYDMWGEYQPTADASSGEKNYGKGFTAKPNTYFPATPKPIVPHT